jgi:hypothetical protein
METFLIDKALDEKVCNRQGLVFNHKKSQNRIII